MRRTLGGLTAIALVIGGGYGISLYFHKAEMERIVARLTGETRVASAIVMDQFERDVDGDVKLHTTVRFVAIDRDGKDLQPRLFTVVGESVYFEALVIKFEHDFVKWGDDLRGRSLHLFRRAFGEEQAPIDGFELEGPNQDTEGVPENYQTSNQPSKLEVDLWRDFWHYANDPKAAKEQGVRVMQGEAVFIPMKPRKVYHLTMDNSGGLNIKAEEWPSEIPWPPSAEH